MSRIGKIILTKEEEQKLLSWSRSQKMDYRYVVRAKIILMSAEKSTYEEIIKGLQISRPVISKWKSRFIQNRVEGLKDLPRPGKPSKYGEAEKARVIQMACSKPEEGYSNYSQRRIAQKLGLSQTKVQNILKQNNLKPHKVEYWCGKSTDPDFE